MRVSSLPELSTRIWRERPGSNMGKGHGSLLQTQKRGVWGGAWRRGVGEKKGCVNVHVLGGTEGRVEEGG